MHRTKYQHLMCVGSYDPLPSTFGPPIRKEKAGQPKVEVKAKPGFTMKDGKAVAYDPFSDPTSNLYLTTQKQKLIKVSADFVSKLTHKGYYAGTRPDEEFTNLYIHRTKSRCEKLSQSEEAVTRSVPGSYQTGLVDRHTVNTPAPVEKSAIDRAFSVNCLVASEVAIYQLAAYKRLSYIDAKALLHEGLDYSIFSEIDAYLDCSRVMALSQPIPLEKYHAVNCRAIISEIEGHMSEFGLHASYAEWLFSTGLSDSLKEELNQYLASITSARHAAASLSPEGKLEYDGLPMSYLQQIADQESASYAPKYVSSESDQTKQPSIFEVGGQSRRTQPVTASELAVMKKSGITHDSTSGYINGEWIELR